MKILKDFYRTNKTKIKQKERDDSEWLKNNLDPHTHDSKSRKPEKENSLFFSEKTNKQTKWLLIPIIKQTKINLYIYILKSNYKKSKWFNNKKQILKEILL